MLDIKDSSNAEKYLDDETYINLIQDQGLNPFQKYVGTNLIKLKRARIEAFLSIAGDDEKTRRIKEAMTETGDWDIYNHIKALRFDISQMAKDIYGP